MYRACIFCSAPLGRNQTISTFPVGSRIAFDAWKGRLWVICAKCQRWNLAPIEERWEAVEQAEEQFRDARTRVQSENIGLARLKDGTRLVRVGEALPGELAAWRYGDRIVRRQREYMWAMGAAGVGGVALVAGMPLIAAAGIPFGLVSAGAQVGAQMQLHRARRRVVLQLDADESPTGRALVVRRQHLYDARVASSGETLSLTIPDAAANNPLLRRIGERSEQVPLELTGERAERAVARALVDFNHRGGSRNDVSTAIGMLTQAGSARAFLTTLGAEGSTLVRRPGNHSAQMVITPGMIIGTFRGKVIPIRPYRSPFFSDAPALSRVQALALEMSLHEDVERRALEGELGELLTAWREAEEIAGIADALPDDPPQLGS